jgi:hypothetical protein
MDFDYFRRNGQWTKSIFEDTLLSLIMSGVFYLIVLKLLNNVKILRDLILN